MDNSFLKMIMKNLHFIILTYLFISIFNTAMMHANKKMYIKVPWRFKFNPMNIMLSPEYLNETGKKYWKFQLFILLIMIITIITLTIMKVCLSY